MRNAVLHGFELVAGSAAAALLTLWAIIYLGRVVGPVEYGDFSAALAVIYLVGVALSPVIPTVARIAAQHAMNDDLSSVMRLRSATSRIALGCAAAVTLAAAALLRPVAQWLKFRSTTTLALAFGTALVYILLSIDRGFLQGLSRFRAYNANIVAEAAVRVLLVVSFARLFPAASFAMTAWAIGTATAYAMVHVVLARASVGIHRGPPSSTSAFLTMLRPMMVFMLAFAVFQNTDLLAVKRWLQPELAGAYGAASALSRGFGVFFVPLYALAGPMLTQLQQRRRKVFSTTLWFAAGYVALVVVPLLIVVIWPEPIVTMLYGRQYEVAGAILAPLCGIATLTYVGLMLAQGLITIGDYRFVRVYAAAAAAQVVGLSLAHDSFHQILATLYLAQGSAVLVVAIMFWRARSGPLPESHSPGPAA